MSTLDSDIQGPKQDLPVKRTLAVAFFTILVDMMGFGIAFPILPVIFGADSEWFPNLSPEQLSIWYGLLQASFPFAQFIGAPILGALSDRFGRRPILMLTLVGATIGYGLFAYGIKEASLTWMFIGRILPGFAGGNIALLYSAMADISGGKEKVRNFGLAGSAFGLGMILGPVVGGFLSDPDFLAISGNHVPFVLMSILSAAAVLLVFGFFRETLTVFNPTPISPLTGVRNIRDAFAHPRLRYVFATILIHASGFSLFIQFIHFWLIEVHEFEQFDIGLIFGYVGLWTVITQALLVRPLANWFTPERIVANVIILLGISVVIIQLPGNSIWLYVILPFATIFQGLYMPNMTAVVSNLSDRDIQGRMMGINQSLTAFSNAFPPAVGGWLLMQGVQVPLYVAVGCHVLAWIVFNAFYLRYKKGKL